MAEKKEKEEFDREAFKKAIAWVESSGGKHLSNPTSSAAGKYHFLYRYIKGAPILKGVTIREFINSPELQEKVMDMAIDGDLPGFPSYKDYASNLKSKFNSDMEVHEIAALTHFLGMGGVKKFMSNPAGFKVPGKNASVKQYLDRFNGAFKPSGKVNKKGYRPPSPGNEKGLNVKVQDATAVAPKTIKTDIFQAGTDDYIEYLNTQGLSKEDPNLNPGNQVTNQDSNQVAQDGAQVTAQDNLPVTTPPPISAELEGLPEQDFMNKLAMGGFTNTHGAQDIIPIENGGTHEENPYGGVPMGVGQNGKINTVEEGEVKFGDYIFSNRLSLGGYMKSVEDANPNTFENGGDLTDPDPTDPKKKKSVAMRGRSKTDPKKDKESKKNVETLGPHPEDKPLEFTKSEPQFMPGGGLRTVSETFEVPDVRDKYITTNFLSTEPGQVQFPEGDAGSQSFLERYNDPWTRQKLKEQANLSDEDIDNMILKGLNTEKQIGGNVSGSKAQFDADKNLIMMGEEHKDEAGVESHERVHSSLFDAAQGENLMNVLGNPFQQEGRSFMKKMSPETVRYLKKPHEAYGNFVEFREKLGLKPGEQLDEAKLKKLVKKKNLGSENFYRVYNDKNITKALNTIAAVDNTEQEEYRIA